MLDQYSRNIDYIRISVTDRCNLRCIYCMPQTRKTYLRQEELLTYDEIVKLAGIYRSLGIKNVKLTGGEPLVREHVDELIFRLKEECGMEKVTLTTNGILLEQQLDGLVKAGLDGVNISLDTLNPEHYNRLTGGCNAGKKPSDSNLEAVLWGMRKAQKQAGISVKVNCVLMHQTREELLALAELAKGSINVRFIELMPIGQGKEKHTLKEAEVKQILCETYGTIRSCVEKPVPPVVKIRSALSSSESSHNSAASESPSSGMIFLKTTS
jgi:GTP 3',8-cyclase